MSEQIFLYIDGIRTWWVLRKESGEAYKTAGPIVVLPSATPTELQFSVLLYDYPMILCNSDAETVACAPYGKLLANVIKTTCELRQECAVNNALLNSLKYDPQKYPPPPQQQQLQQQLDLTQQQNQQPASGIMNMMGSYPIQGGMYMHNPTAMYHQRGFDTFPQQHSAVSALLGTTTAGRESEENALKECQPLVLPEDIEIPEDELKEFVNSTTRVYVAPMRGTRVTVWLRDHTVRKNLKETNIRYNNVTPGLTVVLNLSIEDLKKDRPVALFDKQLCAFFLQKGFCGLIMCLHTHRSEEQVRTLMLYKQAEYEEKKTEEQHQLIEELIEHEKEALKTPGSLRSNEVTPEKVVFDHYTTMGHKFVPPQPKQPKRTVNSSHSSKRKTGREGNDTSGEADLELIPSPEFNRTNNRGSGRNKKKEDIGIASSSSDDDNEDSLAGSLSSTSSSSSLMDDDKDDVFGEKPNFSVDSFEGSLSSSSTSSSSSRASSSSSRSMSSTSSASSILSSPRGSRAPTPSSLRSPKVRPIEEKSDKVERPSPSLHAQTTRAVPPKETLPSQKDNRRGHDRDVEERGTPRLRLPTRGRERASSRDSYHDKRNDAHLSYHRYPEDDHDYNDSRRDRREEERRHYSDRYSDRSDSRDDSRRRSDARDRSRSREREPYRPSGRGIIANRYKRREQKGRGFEELESHRSYDDRRYWDGEREYEKERYGEKRGRPFIDRGVDYDRYGGGMERRGRGGKGRQVGGLRGRPREGMQQGYQRSKMAGPIKKQPQGKW